jgi:hypothetical protein
MHLASYADADGGAIFPGISTVAKEMGYAYRTITYAFAELRALRFLKDEGFSSDRYKHTRIRRLDIAAILKAGAVGQDSQDSSETVGQDSPTVGQDSSTVGQDSNSALPENRESCPQPSCLTVHQTVQPTMAGLEGWKKKNTTTMGVADKKAEQWLRQQVEMHAESIVVAALEKYLQRPNGFIGVKTPWALLYREFPSYVELALQDTRDAADKAKLNEATEVLVQQQMREHAAFMESEPAPTIGECEPEIV